MQHSRKGSLAVSAEPSLVFEPFPKPPALSERSLAAGAAPAAKDLSESARGFGNGLKTKALLKFPSNDLCPFAHLKGLEAL
ncbi:hypothetical protein RHSIM_Rhsim10G0197100 [Rhododendron simsii]|uniref:Uncharacterized protein n=1 Tax=Rhododendron simsii TaxID=118357 RepID=A0A834GE45_RHOSS|nr:hypothetical protein RHSIM_Rhsim10G0197100 [Rhododendron simsii]